MNKPKSNACGNIPCGEKTRRFHFLRSIYGKGRVILLRRLLGLIPHDPILAQQIYLRSLHGMQVDQIKDPRVSIGAFTYGMRSGALNIWLDNDQVTVGSFCSVAEGVRFVFGEHPTNLVSTFPLRTILSGGKNVDTFNKGPVIVGSDVWIGTNAIILSGVKIGHGAVIAAGAVVTRDVPPFAVAAGIPARVVKMRLRNDQIEELLKIAWWDWPEPKIRAHLDDFYGDVDTFIERHRSVFP